MIINPRSSSCVRGLTKEETEAVFDFRAALESTVVRKVTGKLSAERLMEFRKVFIEFLNSMESFISPEELIRGFFDIETQLHEYMIKACPSIISGEIMNLMDLTKRIRHLHMLYKLNNMNASAFNDEVGLHVRLIDSLVAEDIPVSVKLIEKDILDTKDEIMKCFDIINGI